MSRRRRRACLICGTPVPHAGAPCPECGYRGQTANRDSCVICGAEKFSQNSECLSCGHAPDSIEEVW